MGDAVQAQRHRGGRRHATDAQLTATPQPQGRKRGASDQQHAERVIDDLEGRDHAHLAKHGLQELAHRTFRIVAFATRMREEFDGRDVRVGVRDPPGHHRARICLRGTDAREARDEPPAGQAVRHKPRAKRHQETRVKVAHDPQERHEVERDVDEDIGDDEPRIANGERGLHHLRGHTAGKFVLIERQTLREHAPVKIPAHAHREITGEPLTSHEALVTHERNTRHQHDAKDHHGLAFARKEVHAIDRRQPVDEMPKHPKERRFKNADRRRRQGHEQDLSTHAARAGPEERDQARRQTFRFVLRIRVDDAFELTKHLPLHARIMRAARCTRVGRFRQASINLI